MNNHNAYGSSVGSFIEGMINPQAAIFILVALLAIASAGALVGMISRNIVILIGVGALGVGFLYFHMYLPLPDDIQAEIFLLKARIGL